jgi:hypothetical protein
MKIPEWLIWLVVAFAVLQMSLGGLRDMLKRDSIVPGIHHSFSDGIFYILLAIFFVLYNRS